MIAAKSLEKLPKKISHRINKKLEQSKCDPFLFFERLKDREEYKLRVGSYRIIADIKNNELLILVLLIDHRKRVYKR